MVHIAYEGSLGGARLLTAVLAGNGIDTELVTPDGAADPVAGAPDPARLLIRVSDRLLRSVDARVIRSHIARSVRQLHHDGIAAHISIIDDRSPTAIPSDTSAW